MSHEDFDVDSLAAYLHLDPQKVMRLADRGKIPARKVGGDWVFSGSEIHHWLEDRIGVSDDQELAEVEGVLRSNDDVAEPAPLVQMLPIEAIAIPLVARTRNSVITAMCDLAAQTGLLWDPEKMAEAVRDREEMHPTALENGVALMHPRRPLPGILGEAFLALGRTDGGIPFGGSRGVLTDVFFLIMSTDDRGHLSTLARLSRMITDADFMQQLRRAPDAVAVRELFSQKEDEYTVG
jgi:PTS system nitrogen regulatory IIA component